VYELDGYVSQFGERQILGYAVFVIHDQGPLTIDFYASDHAFLDFTIATKSESHYKCHVGSHTGLTPSREEFGGQALDLSIGSCFAINSEPQFKSFLMIVRDEFKHYLTI
jgi:hypothetical protein